MGIWIPPSGGIGPRQTNITAADRNGTTITTSGTAHTKGAYSAGQLIATADQDTYGLTVVVDDVAVANTNTRYLLDIGVGASGSERTLIENLNVGFAGGAGTDDRPKSWFFPVFIPQGERLSARGQALAVSDIAEVGVYLHQSAAGYGMEVPTLWEGLGISTAASQGTNVTPASGSFGSWTTILDPITKDYKWWHVGYGASTDTTIATGGITVVQIGIGDTSGAVTTIGEWVFYSGQNEIITGPFPSEPVYWPINADTVNGVFARLASFETEVRDVAVYAAE